MADNKIPAVPEDPIKAALSQNWEAAIRINIKILKENKKNVDALNRLGFAYLMSGKKKLAKETFDTVLKIDKYNGIAQKNLKKINLIKVGDINTEARKNISPLLFLEEPGKTKIVECINVAPKQTLSYISCGQEVTIKTKRHSIEIRDHKNGYIGALPDDISFKLIKMMESGNEYSIHIKSINKSCISVFIREIKRGASLASQPSFTSTTNYIPFTREEKKPDDDSDTPEEKSTEEEA